MTDIEKLEALAKAADDSEKEANTIMAQFGYCVRYWDAATNRNDALDAFKNSVEPSAISELIKANRQLQSELAAARAGYDDPVHEAYNCLYDFACGVVSDDIVNGIQETLAKAKGLEFRPYKSKYNLTDEMEKLHRRPTPTAKETKA